MGHGVYNTVEWVLYCSVPFIQSKQLTWSDRKRSTCENTIQSEWNNQTPNIPLHQIVAVLQCLLYNLPLT